MHGRTSSIKPSKPVGRATERGVGHELFEAPHPPLRAADQIGAVVSSFALDRWQPGWPLEAPLLTLGRSSLHIPRLAYHRLSRGGRAILR